MRSALLVLPFVAACAFVPDSIADAPRNLDSAAARLDCLEVELLELNDPRVTYHVGNRCARPVGIDFRKVIVTGGGQVLPPYDPRGELREAELDAYGQANVTILYPGYAAHFCVDVGGLEVDAPSPCPMNLCFAQSGNVWLRVPN